MKLSKSKLALAKVINENGGWVDCEAIFAAMDGNGDLFGYSGKPQWTVSRGHWYGHTLTCWFFSPVVIKNHHQTILSREEYFHLYPAPDAEPEFCESVMRTIPEPEAKPSIEQLAADYRNKLDYANRKQQEADAAKVDAEAKLTELVAAGKVLGLVIDVRH